jgi:DNA-binding XRE family transcriptional regulator
MDTMPYSQKIIEKINEAPKALGTELGRWAVRRDISMQRISQIIGASRQTVYNWFTGTTEVTTAYQERVAKVIEVLRQTSQTDDAWRILCTTFNHKP